MVEQSTMEKPKTKYLFCNNCMCETEHTCEGEHYRDFSEYKQGILVYAPRQGYRLLICSGCKTGTLEDYYIFDVTSTDYKSEDMWNYRYYPERNKVHMKPKEFKQLPKKLRFIYEETLGAYNNQLSILCALGVRSLLEGICADKGISGGTLEIKIGKMVSILPENIVENLHSIRFIGNEAAHELSAPTIDELKLAIELCEDLLNFIYELNYKARTLSDSRKLREKNIKKVDVTKSTSS